MNLPTRPPRSAILRLFYELLFEALSVVIAMNYPFSSCLGAKLLLLAYSRSYLLVCGSSVVSNNFSLPVTENEEKKNWEDATTSSDWGWRAGMVDLHKYCSDNSKDLLLVLIL